MNTRRGIRTKNAKTQKGRDKHNWRVQDKLNKKE